MWGKIAKILWANNTESDSWNKKNMHDPSHKNTVSSYYGFLQIFFFRKFSIKQIKIQKKFIINSILHVFFVRKLWLSFWKFWLSFLFQLSFIFNLTTFIFNLTILLSVQNRYPKLSIVVLQCNFFLMFLNKIITRTKTNKPYTVHCQLL
jgi:presenilin-like A22 family membrane protease